MALNNYYKFGHLMKSDIAKDENVNNFPGIDEIHDPCLTKKFIYGNLNLLFYHVVNPIMEAFGETDIIITSAYRCRKLQRIMGGNLNSPHTKGQAVDITSLSRPTALLWNWCYYNLPIFNQIICEYPERGSITNNINYEGLKDDFSWVHVSYINGNNPKTSSISTKREDVHEMYKSDTSTRIGDYTHNIILADDKLF